MASNLNIVAARLEKNRAERTPFTPEQLRDHALKVAEGLQKVGVPINGAVHAIMHAKNTVEIQGALKDALAACSTEPPAIDGEPTAAERVAAFHRPSSGEQPGALADHPVLFDTEEESFTYKRPNPQELAYLDDIRHGREPRQREGQ